MKNSMKHFNFAPAPLAALMVVGLTAFGASAAGPVAVPPGGNVNPVFNSVTVNDGTTDNLKIEANGNISNATANSPVNISDPDGIKSYATGFNAIGGDFQGIFDGVRASASGLASTGGEFSATGVGVKGTSTGAGSGSGGIFFGEGFGVLGSSSGVSGIGGQFSNSGSGGINVILGAQTYALGVKPTVGGNVFQINNKGEVSNQGPNTAPNNYGEVTVNDDQGFTVKSKYDAIEAYPTNGMIFYGDNYDGSDGMYVGTYHDNTTGITADSNYPGSTAFYGSGGDRVIAGQSGNIGGDLYGDNVGIQGATRSTGTAVMGEATYSSPGGTWPGGGVGGRFEAYKGVGVIGDATDGGLAGKFYYLTLGGGGLENNLVQLATPTKSIITDGDVDFKARVFNSGTTPSCCGRPPTNNPLFVDDSLSVTGGISASGVGAPFASFNNVDINSGLRVSSVWPMGFDTDTRFENGGIIVSNVAGGGGPTNASITKTGHMTASQGFGKVYTKLGPAPGGSNVPASGFGAAPAMSCNSGNDRVMNCGIDYSSSGNVSSAGESVGVSTCTAYAHNNGAVATTARGYITCMDPDAATW